MNEGLYGCNEVFDVYVSTVDSSLEDTLNFKIETMSSFKFSKYEDEDIFYLKITDALIDMNVFNGVVNGLYDGVGLKIKAVTEFRKEVNDYNAVFESDYAEMHEYHFGKYAKETAYVTFVFKFPVTGGFSSLSIDGGDQ